MLVPIVWYQIRQDGLCFMCYCGYHMDCQWNKWKGPIGKAGNKAKNNNKQAQFYALCRYIDLEHTPCEEGRNKTDGQFEVPIRVVEQIKKLFPYKEEHKTTTEEKLREQEEKASAKDEAVFV